MATQTHYEVKRDDSLGEPEYRIACDIERRTFIVYVTAQGVNYPSMSPCPPDACRFMAEVLMLGARLSEELAAEGQAS